MSDFPRGWTYSTYQQSSGLAASIVVPACPGVSHVLDSFDAKLLNGNSTGTLGFTVNVFASGALVISMWIWSVGPGSDEITPSGLGIASAPGATLTVQFSSGAPANITQGLMIQGHDN